MKQNNHHLFIPALLQQLYILRLNPLMIEPESRVQSGMYKVLFDVYSRRIASLTLILIMIMVSHWI